MDERQKVSEAVDEEQPEPLTIDMRSLDPRFRMEVEAEPGAEHLQRCFACGVCTGSCPVSEIDSRFSPSRIMRMVLLGMRDAVLGGEEIWYCAQCFSCSFHCPQDVNFAEVIKALRHLAVADGNVSEAFADAVEEVGRLSQAVRVRLLERLLASKGEVEIPDLKGALQEVVQEEGGKGEID